jgi:predicted ATPase
MADVFISYASSDESSPREVATVLEDAGFSVWWDRDLVSGQRFQDAIVKELNSAAAVVVVWSPASVRSDWVYSEARRASDQRKLVQVRTPGLHIDDLPAPFDAYHCGPVTDHRALTEAVRSLVDRMTHRTPAAEGLPRQEVRRAPLGELPRGTVTFVHAAVESSAERVHEWGDRWADALHAWRSLGQEIWARWHGHELPADVDSAMAAFARAGDAVSAAADLQRGVQATAWPATIELGVRIGVHTGSPQLLGDMYVGTDVDRAVQVALAGHPGQILLSEATVRLVEHDLPPGRTSADLGTHRLHDVPGVIGLHQLLDDGLPRSFPPPRTRGAAGSLPVVLSALVGREQELAELRDLLAAGHRLVTLVGPGGTGKSRLAVALAAEVAGEFPDGVYFVPLHSATTAADMWSGAAEVLDLPPNGQQPPDFFDHIGDKRLLLVLDNLEQIPDADLVARELLASAPQVTVLATSRRPLHVGGEHEFLVPPLALPGGASRTEVARAAAVQMFVQAASRVRHGFAVTDENAADVAALCAALDGLPLAIELSAARTKMLSPKAILTRIEQSLDISSTDRTREGRHVSLRSTIAWSFELLGADHQAVLERLSVFEGAGAPLEALAAVVPEDVLARVDVADVVFDLVDASLVRVADEGPDGEPRFSLLETIKRFLRDRLNESGQLADAERRHAQLCYDLAARHWDERMQFSYRSVRTQLLAAVPDFAAVVARRPTEVADSHYPDSMAPVLHVVALFAGHAVSLRRYATVVHWSETALRDQGTDGDRAGCAALLVRAAYVHAYARHDAVSERRAAEALELIGEKPSPGEEEQPLRPWVDLRHVRPRALFIRCQALLALGREEESQACLASLRSLVKRPGDEAHLDALECEYQRAMWADDFKAARVSLDELSGVVDPGAALWANLQNSLADLDVQEGLIERARGRIGDAAETIIHNGDPLHLLNLLETLGETYAGADPATYARTIGCCDAAREREGLSLSREDHPAMYQVFHRARRGVSPREWEAAVERGRHDNLVDLLRELAGGGEPCD